MVWLLVCCSRTRGEEFLARAFAAATFAAGEGGSVRDFREVRIAAAAFLKQVLFAFVGCRVSPAMVTEPFSSRWSDCAEQFRSGFLTTVQRFFATAARFFFSHFRRRVFVARRHGGAASHSGCGVIIFFAISQFIVVFFSRRSSAASDVTAATNCVRICCV